jgi:hypothetical protein
MAPVNSKTLTSAVVNLSLLPGMTLEKICEELCKDRESIRKAVRRGIVAGRISPTFAASLPKPGKAFRKFQKGEAAPKGLQRRRSYLDSVRDDTERQIAEFLATRGAAVCPTRYATGSVQSNLFRFQLRAI